MASLGILVRYGFAWFPMVPIALLNGALRVYVYDKWVGELPAHQISTVTAILILGCYIYGVTRRWPLESRGNALLIGTEWAAMTVAFEFLFGHFVAGHAWPRLFHDYNIAAGRIWVFVPVWIGAAPYVFHALHRRSL